MSEEILDESFRKEISVNNQKEPSLPNTTRANAAIILTALSSFMYLMVAIFAMIAFTNRNEYIEFYDALASYEVIDALSLIIFIPSAVLFVIWFARAYKNVWRREKTEMSPGWAIGSWFIPVYSLYKPFQLAKEVANKNSLRLSKKNPLVNIMVLWWVFWIFSSLLSNIEGQIESRSYDIESETMLVFSMFSSITGVIAGILCISYIIHIKKLESEIYSEESASLANGAIE